MFESQVSNGICDFGQVHGPFWSSVFQCGHVCVLVVVVGIAISSDGHIVFDSNIMTEGSTRKRV